MGNWHCKIGRITPKNGVILLDKPFKPPSLGQDTADRAKLAIDNMFEWSGLGVMAMAIVVYNKDGTFNRFTRYHKDAPFGETLFPEIFSAILRRDVVERVAEDVFNGTI